MPSLSDIFSFVLGLLAVIGLAGLTFIITYIIRGY